MSSVNVRQVQHEWCGLDQRREVQVPIFPMSRPEALAKRRSHGIDPPHGGKANGRREARQSKRARDRAEWDAIYGDGQAEREHFIREVQMSFGYGE